MYAAAAVVLLLMLAAAAISYATRQRAAAFEERDERPPQPPQFRKPSEKLRVERTSAPVTRHLHASDATEGTHTLIHENGLPGLEGKSSFAELGTSVDDRMARVHGAHQRRYARTLSRPKTAQAMDMMRPWLEPRMAAGQSRDWWGAEDVNAP
jgi:hypothetical protein